MLQVLKASRSNPNQPLPAEIKEFISQVELVHLDTKGRGLQTQQEFAPGDLIMAQRALAIVFPDPVPTSITSPLLSKVMKFRLLKESVIKLIMSNSEELEQQIFSLHAGPKLGYFNEDQFQEYRRNKTSTTKGNKLRIEGILVVNGFEGQKRDALEGPFGLWDIPSFLNHDCFKSNANWEIYNDFMFIRATKFIPKGQEILISYIDPDQPNYIRRDMFLKHDFVCSCKLCFLEKKEGEDICRKRDNLLSDFKAYVNPAEDQTPPNSEVIQGFINKLNALRSIMLPKIPELATDLNPFILQPLMHLGLIYFEQKEYRKAIEAFQEAFDICENFRQFYSVALCLSVAIVNCYLKLGTTNTSEKTDWNCEERFKWIMKVKESLLIQYGCKEDADAYEILKLIKPEFVEEMRKHGIRF